MNRAVRLELWGEDPVPQGSKTGFVIPGTNRVSMVDANAKKLKPWRNRIHLEAAAVMGTTPVIEGPVIVHATFIFARPKSHYGTGKNASVLKLSSPRFKFTKPDLDKLARAVLDGITGPVVKDDAQVVDLSCVKLYGEQAGAVVVVTEMP